MRPPTTLYSAFSHPRGSILFSRRPSRLKAISDVVAELVHAANFGGRLSDSEKLMLLTRAYITIQEGDEALGNVEATANSDVRSSTGMVSSAYKIQWTALADKVVEYVARARDGHRSGQTTKTSKKAARKIAPSGARSRAHQAQDIVPKLSTPTTGKELVS